MLQLSGRPMSWPQPRTLRTSRGFVLPGWMIPHGASDRKPSATCGRCCCGSIARLGWIMAPAMDRPRICELSAASNISPLACLVSLNILRKLSRGLPSNPRTRAGERQVCVQTRLRANTERLARFPVDARMKDQGEAFPFRLAVDTAKVNTRSGSTCRRPARSGSSCRAATSAPGTSDRPSARTRSGTGPTCSLRPRP
jgi:hypothetical protein